MEWDHHEGAVLDVFVGDGEVGNINAVGTVEEDVDVDDAGMVDAVACAVIFRSVGSAHRALYRLDFTQDFHGRVFRRNFRSECSVKRHGVQELATGESHRFGLNKPRESCVMTFKGFVHAEESLFDVLLAVAKVAAEGKVYADKGHYEFGSFE